MIRQAFEIIPDIMFYASSALYKGEYHHQSDDDNGDDPV
jgi:hypothetical protein